MANVTRYTVKLVKEDCKRYEVDNPINTITKAVKLLNNVYDFEHLPNEMFVMLALDAKKKIIGTFIISQGVINATLVSPRDIYQRAFLANAQSIIVAHNHPSGNPEPSKEDKVLTKNIVDAGNVMGVEVCDSLIICGEDNYYSFLAEGLIWKMKKEQIKKAAALVIQKPQNIKIFYLLLLYHEGVKNGKIFNKLHNEISWKGWSYSKKRRRGL